MTHAVLRVPAAVRNLRHPHDEEGGRVSPNPAPPTVSRRGPLAAGRSFDGPQWATALLAPHGGPEPGSGPGGFQINSQLTMRLTYKTPAAPNFAVDGFQGQQHNAITDHNDFINVMTDPLMKQAVSCINSGRRCG